MSVLHRLKGYYLRSERRFLMRTRRFPQLGILFVGMHFLPWFFAAGLVVVPLFLSAQVVGALLPDWWTFAGLVLAMPFMFTAIVWLSIPFFGAYFRVVGALFGNIAGVEKRLHYIQKQLERE